MVKKTVLIWAIFSASEVAFFASALLEALENSSLTSLAESGLTGGEEEVWARALAREKGYVMVDAMDLLIAAIKNVILAPGSSRWALGTKLLLKNS